MRIIGCDLHTRQQTIAMLDTDLLARPHLTSSTRCCPPSLSTPLSVLLRTVSMAVTQSRVGLLGSIGNNHGADHDSAQWLAVRSVAWFACEPADAGGELACADLVARMDTGESQSRAAALRARKRASAPRSGVCPRKTERTTEDS